MSIFQPITLSFAGKDYTIPANEIMRCLAQIEDVITLNDLTNERRVPVVRLSMAYGIALRYAGADVTDEDIYDSVFEKAGAGLVSKAVGSLLAMMIPPTKLQERVSTKTTKKQNQPRKN